MFIWLWLGSKQWKLVKLVSTMTVVDFRVQRLPSITFEYNVQLRQNFHTYSNNIGTWPDDQRDRIHTLHHIVMKTSNLKVMFTWTIVGQLLDVWITSARFYWLRYDCFMEIFVHPKLETEIRKPYRWRGSLITVNHQMNNDVPYINEIGMAIPCS